MRIFPFLTLCWLVPGLVAACAAPPPCVPGYSRVEWVEGWRRKPMTPGGSEIYEYGNHPIWVCEEYER